MKTKIQILRILYRFQTYLTIVILLLAFSSISTAVQTNNQISKQDAAKKVLSTTVMRIWEKADQKKGMRVHQFGVLLPKGTRVQSAFIPEGKESKVLVCKNPTWLFFIDEDPAAHFAHSARVILLDAETGEQQIVKTDWWPLINDKPVFSKIKERSDPETIIFDKKPIFKKLSEELKEILSGLNKQIKSHDPCDSWAIIVCGYDDLPDTFDEDTNGIYTVLTGLGIPDNHIFYVSPHTADAGVDLPTSIANVQWAINQITGQSDETDKVLFFYSSHGNVDSLSCVPSSVGGGSITSNDLDNWLDAITCDELTIVIEACHSGSFIGKYENGTYVASEDDLTGDGETNRAVFTSASSDTSSYPDIDDALDPNPGDSGSETIWGYIEAFSSATADVNNDGEISFGEGWQYAWDNDVTRILGWNTPQMTHTGLAANNVYNYCYRVTGSGDLFIADGAADVGNNSYDYDSTDIWVTQNPLETDHQDVVSGMENLVHVAVHNRGTSNIANVSLKVYWGNVSTAMSWPSDFNQIGITHNFGSLASGDTHTHTWTWNVDPSIGLGHNFCLIAVADSPADPMVGGPSGVTYVAPYDNNIAQKNITIIQDTGSGHGSFAFVLKNNTAEFEAVDLEIEWIGKPWGNAVIVLPEDLLQSVKDNKIKLDSIKVIRLPEKDLPGLLVTGDTKAKIQNIPLKPEDSRVVSLIMKTKKTKPGQRSEIRLIQKAKDIILGVITARLEQVHPFDCNWVTRISVEAFADLAARFRIQSANEVSQIFAQAILNGMCCMNEKLLEMLAKILMLEKEILRHLPSTVPPEVQKNLTSCLKELEMSINDKKINTALFAQGKIAQLVKKLSNKQIHTK